MSDIPGQPIMPIATVNLLDVFTKVIELQMQLAAINEKLADLPDHETRLRVLEAGRARTAGAAAALGSICGGGAGWIALLMSRH